MTHPELGEGILNGRFLVTAKAEIPHLGTAMAMTREVCGRVKWE